MQGITFLESTADRGERFEVKTWVPVTILNPNFYGL